LTGFWFIVVTSLLSGRAKYGNEDVMCPIIDGEAVLTESVTAFATKRSM
jgi:hypothetical protein